MTSPPHPTLFDTPSVRADAPATSIKAAARSAKTLSRRMESILFYIRENGGATDDELQIVLSLDGNSERPARQSLQKRNLIYPSAERHITRSGNEAIVWKVL
jgi:hypothetical protein